jgi:hypothetical protein
MEKINPQSLKSRLSLRMYSTQEIEKALTAIRDAYNRGLIESADVEHFLGDFKFRDSALRYWTVGIQTGKWYWRSPTGWAEAAKPTERLESLADFSLKQAFAVDNLTVTADTENQPVSPLPPPPPPPDMPAQQPNYATVTMTQTPKNRFCTKCGKSLDPRANFCNNCGSTTK